MIYIVDSQSAGRAFIARQPIVNTWRAVVGYELILRDGTPDGDEELRGEPRGELVEEASGEAANFIADAVLVDGVIAVTEGLPGWIKLNEAALISSGVEALDPAQFVIELVGRVQPTRPVLAACRVLQDAGFTVVLDDVGDERRLSLFEDCINVVKVDWQRTPPLRRAAASAQAQRRGLSALANNLQTDTELNGAIALGFDLLQGYATGRPTLLPRHSLSASKLQSIRLLELAGAEEVDFAQAAEILANDPVLTFKVLAYANSAQAAQSRPVIDIRQGLILFGEENLRRAALLIFLTQEASAAPSFAVIDCLVAGFFCGSIARTCGHERIANSCMLAATLSYLDRLLGEDLELILMRLPIHVTLREAVLHHTGDVGRLVQLTRALQAGNWSDADDVTQLLRIRRQQLPSLYEAALAKAGQLWKLGAAA